MQRSREPRSRPTPTCSADFDRRTNAFQGGDSHRRRRSHRTPTGEPGKVSERAGTREPLCDRPGSPRLCPSGDRGRSHPHPCWGVWRGAMGPPGCVTKTCRQFSGSHSLRVPASPWLEGRRCRKRGRQPFLTRGGPPDSGTQQWGRRTRPRQPGVGLPLPTHPTLQCPIRRCFPVAWGAGGGRGDVHEGYQLLTPSLGASADPDSSPVSPARPDPAGSGPSCGPRA